jgi:hypothetical protein
MVRYSLLPLWEKVARSADEGSLSAETNPSPVTNALRASVPPSPTRGEGKELQCPLWDFFIASSCSALAVP